MAIIESEQSREVQLTQIDRGPFILRFASYRKNEDAEYNLRSEDYIVSDITPSRAIFALCDGVGSSFYGDIGSQILGELLLNWLQKLRLEDVLSAIELASDSVPGLVRNLQQELEKSIKLATSIVEKKDIRTGKDDLTHIAEKDQRDQFGTQSNFVGGVVWPGTQSLPNGLVLLFWLGNARVRIFFQNTELPPLAKWGEDTDQQKEVWSSKEGVVGQVYSYITDLSKITSILAHSDGLEKVENRIIPGIVANQLEELVSQAQSMKDDDISFLELTTYHSAVAGSSDDISSLLREHLNMSARSSDAQARVPAIPVQNVPSSNIQAQNSVVQAQPQSNLGEPPKGSNTQGSNPEVQALKRQVRDLLRKIEDLSQSYDSKRRLYKVGLLSLPVLFLIFGCIIGALLSPLKEGSDKRTVVITSPPIVVTRRVCPTATTTPTPTYTPTDSLVETNTNTPTPTEATRWFHIEATSETSPTPSVTIDVSATPIPPP